MIFQYGFFSFHCRVGETVGGGGGGRPGIVDARGKLKDNNVIYEVRNDYLKKF